jgi:hypothetical protein
LGSPEGAVDVGGLEVDLIAGKKAVVTIEGRVALKVDVKGYAAFNAGTEISTSVDVVGIELLVSQVRGGRDGSNVVLEDIFVARRGASLSRDLLELRPGLPFSDSLVTVVLLVMNTSCN